MDERYEKFLMPIFFSEEIFITKNYSVDSMEEESAGVAEKPALTEFNFELKGLNRKRVLLILSRSPNETEGILLSKIVENGLKLGEPDVGILHQNDYPRAVAKDYLKAFPNSLFVFFGLYLPEFIKIEGAELNKLIAVGSSSCIFTDGLSELEQNLEAKKNLWQVLKYLAVP